MGDVSWPLREPELQKGHPKPLVFWSSFLSIPSYPLGQRKHTDRKVEHRASALTFRTEGDKCQGKVHTEALGMGDPQSQVPGTLRLCVPQDDLGILLKDKLCMGPGTCICTHTHCGHRAQSRLLRPHCAWPTRVSSVTQPLPGAFPGRPPPAPLGRGLLPCFPTSPRGSAVNGPWLCPSHILSDSCLCPSVSPPLSPATASRQLLVPVCAVSEVGRAGPPHRP